MHRIVIILTRPSSTGPNLNVLDAGNVDEREMRFPRRDNPVGTYFKWLLEVCSITRQLYSIVKIFRT